MHAAHLPYFESMLLIMVINDAEKDNFREKIKIVNLKRFKIDFYEHFDNISRG